MTNPKDLIALHVGTEDLEDYSLTQTGWYAVDDGGAVVLGPFDSLAQCDRAIRERLLPGTGV
jgi:hypothetical protein